MPIKLAERPVDAIEALFVTYLGTELAAIDADRNDGITLAVPTAATYYKRPKPEMADLVNTQVHVEIFENPFQLLGDTRSFGTNIGDERALFEIRLTVRVTYFNRDGDDRDTMVIRMRRYAVGIFNAVVKHSDLADSDDHTLGVQVLAVTPPWIEEGEELPTTFKGRVTVELRVKCEETQS